MTKKIVSLVIALSTMFLTVANAAEYIQNKQKNYDAYTYTNMVENFKYSTSYKGGDYGGYFGYTTGDECIVFKNMDFGRHGAVNVEVKYSAGGNYGGVLEFRKGSRTGELIAEVKSESTGSWNTVKTKTVEVEFPAVASGRFDLYVLVKKSTFGNLYGFKFNETPTAYQTINTVESLKDYIGFADTDFLDTGISVNYDNPDLLGDDYARHLDYYVSFENKNSQEIIIDAHVEIGGKMRIYDNCPDGDILQEITLAEGDGQQTFVASDAIKSLDATQNICIAFDNSVRMEFNSFAFTAEPKLNVEETVFDVSNESSYGGYVIENATFFGGTTGSSAYICWKNVDFGDTAWPMEVTLEYGVGSANNGANANIRIDSNTGPIIASIPMPMKTGGGWESPLTESSVLLQGVTGVHDMYVTIEAGDYTYGPKCGNIFSIDFEVVKEKYGSSYNVLSLNKVPKELKAMVSFVNAEDNPDSILYSFAIYNSEGELISVDSKNELVSEGLNVFERRLDYTSMIASDDYEVKVYLWDSIMKPIDKDTVANYTIVAN